MEEKEFLYGNALHERIENVIVNINSILENYDGNTFRYITKSLNGIRAQIIWDGDFNVNSKEAEETVNFLQYTSMKLMQCEGILNSKDYQKIKSILEYLEIVMSEILIAFV